MDHAESIPLRSPREALGGYVILPRLIDKVRLHARGQLPQEYVGNLLKPGLSLDGWFLTFTDLDAEQLQRVILSSDTDEPVLTWVKRHAQPHTESEQRQWASRIEAYRPVPDTAQRRRESYSEMASIIDVATLSVFDLIDMDEGRRPIPGEG